MTYKYLATSADRTAPIVSTIEDDMKSAAANDGLSDPKHTVRATRTAGRQMRSRLLDAASRLFKEQGLAAVSIADIATAANAFPSQITYYFRTKEALFVEAACRDVLYVGACRRAACGQTTLAGRLYPLAGRQRDGIGCRWFLRRGHDADPPQAGSRAAGGADGRAAALPRVCVPMPRKWPRAAGIRGSIRKRARGGSGRSRSASHWKGMRWAARPIILPPKCCG